MRFDVEADEYIRYTLQGTDLSWYDGGEGTSVVHFELDGILYELRQDKSDWNDSSRSRIAKIYGWINKEKSKIIGFFNIDNLPSKEEFLQIVESTSQGKEHESIARYHEFVTHKELLDKLQEIKFQAESINKSIEEGKVPSTFNQKEWNKISLSIETFFNNDAAELKVKF